MTVNHGVPGSSPGEGAKADSPSAFFMPIGWSEGVFFGIFLAITKKLNSNQFTADWIIYVCFT